LINNNSIEIKENIFKGKIILTYCNKCGRDINHQILMDYCEEGTVILDSDYDFKHGKNDYIGHFCYDYQIIKCLGCDTISYRNYNYFSEYQGIDDDGFREERYPALVKRVERKLEFMPFTFNQIYKEVIITYNNNNFILCASGIRAILEGICKNKGINNNNLKEKITEMSKKGFISQQHECILHKLRFLGNDAIHNLQVPKQDEINSALDIIEHIIESIYDIPEKGERLRSKN